MKAFIYQAAKAECPKCIVVHIQDHKLELDCSEREIGGQLRRLGGRKRFFCERWVIWFGDDEKLGKLLEEIYATWTSRFSDPKEAGPRPVSSNSTGRLSVSH